MLFWFSFFCSVSVFNYASSNPASTESKFIVLSLNYSRLMVVWDPSKVKKSITTLNFSCSTFGEKSETINSSYVPASSGQHIIGPISINEKTLGHEINIEGFWVKKLVERYSILVPIKPKTNLPPPKPNFRWSFERGEKWGLFTRSNYLNLMIQWLPCGQMSLQNCYEKQALTHFIVKYKFLNEKRVININEFNTDTVLVPYIFLGETLEVIVASVNGNIETDSDSQEIFLKPLYNPVRHIKVVPLSNTSIFVSWEPISSLTKPVREYRVFYTTLKNRTHILSLLQNENYQSSNLFTAYFNGIRISNLELGTTYTILISAGIDGLTKGINYATQTYKSELPIAKPDFSYVPNIFGSTCNLIILWLPCGRTMECKDKRPGSSFLVTCYIRKDLHPSNVRPFLKNTDEEKENFEANSRNISKEVEYDAKLINNDTAETVIQVYAGVTLEIRIVSIDEGEQSAPVTKIIYISDCKYPLGSFFEIDGAEIKPFDRLLGL